MCSAPSGCLVNIPSLPEEVEWPHNPNSQEAEATEAQVCNCPALLPSEFQGSQETTKQNKTQKQQQKGMWNLLLIYCLHMLLCTKSVYPCNKPGLFNCRFCMGAKLRLIVTYCVIFSSTLLVWLHLF